MRPFWATRALDREWSPAVSARQIVRAPRPF
jgi:hypothetical protein